MLYVRMRVRRPTDDRVVLCNNGVKFTFLLVLIQRKSTHDVVSYVVKMSICRPVLRHRYRVCVQ